MANIRKNSFYILLLVTIVLFGVGCSKNERFPQGQVNGTEAEIVCEERPGPPDPSLVRCRLLRMSQQGVFSHKLSGKEADILITQLQEIGKASKDWRAGRISPEEFQKIADSADVLCRKYTGLTCAQLAQMPHEK